MTLFTDNPFEKMMIQRPCGRRDNAPPLVWATVRNRYRRNRARSRNAERRNFN